LERILADPTVQMNWNVKFMIAEKIASAMHHLHRHNLMHRDLKSANVLVSDNFEQIYVTDFGTTRGTYNQPTNQSTNQTNNNVARSHYNYDVADTFIDRPN
jgi:serine/threonine protein kinase